MLKVVGAELLSCNLYYIVKSNTGIRRLKVTTDTKKPQLLYD